MKLNGFVGKGSGKLGSSVFAISGGEQIVRQYNPQVSNPQTSAQVEQRAKFKLLSQLAAALAKGLYFTKDGLKSARNQFVSKNMPFVTYPVGIAEVNLLQLQLTGGSVGFYAPNVVRGEANTATANMPEGVSGKVDAVVYVSCEQTATDKLNLMGVIVSQNENDDDFEAAIPQSSREMIVYAYGIKFASGAAKARFANYIFENGDEIATLSANIASALGNGTATQTAATKLNAAG